MAGHVMQLYRLVPSRYLSILGGERRLGIRFRSALGLVPRAPQPNPQSSLTPKNTLIATGYESGSYKRFFKMKFYHFLVIISLNLLDVGILKKLYIRPLSFKILRNL